MYSFMRCATSSQTVQTRGAFCAAISITQWTRERDFIMMRWSLNRAPSPFIAEEGLKNSMGSPQPLLCVYRCKESTNPLFFHASVSAEFNGNSATNDHPLPFSKDNNQLVNLTVTTTIAAEQPPQKRSQAAAGGPFIYFLYYSLSP